MPKRKAPASPEKRLTPRQQAFVRALTADPRQDLTAAAVAAGFSPSSASQTGWDLMNLPQYRHVAAAVKTVMDARLAKYDVTDEAIFRQAAMLAFVDRRKFFQVVGQQIQVTDSADLAPEEAAILSGYRAKSLNDGSGRFVPEPLLPCKLAALQLLAKMKGLLREKIEVDLTARYEEAKRSVNEKLDRLAKEMARQMPEEFEVEDSAEESDLVAEQD